MFGIMVTHMGAAIMYLDYWDDGVIDSISIWMWPFRHYFILVTLLVYAFHITNKFRNSLKNKSAHLHLRREDD